MDSRIVNQSFQASKCYSNDVKSRLAIGTLWPQPYTDWPYYTINPGHPRNLLALIIYLLLVNGNRTKPQNLWDPGFSYAVELPEPRRGSSEP
jgi:hypothetical protein